MKSFYYLGLMSILLSFEVAHSQLMMMPSPLGLKATEQVTFKGNAGDAVTCDGVTYNKQALGIVVTETKDCNCGLEGMKRIYIDGLLAGNCKGNITTKQENKYPDAYINMERLQDFSDDEILKLFGKVGSCHYTKNKMHSNAGTGASSSKLSTLFNSFLLENEKELKAPKDSKEVQAKTLREFAKNGFCGTYDKSTVALNADNSNKILGKLDIGFELIKSSGATGPEMVDMLYPPKKIRAGFPTLTIKDFKRNYDAQQLREAGFTMAELRSVYYGPIDLLHGGYDVKELKPLFTIHDFKRAGYQAINLKAMDYSAQEIKDSGFPLQDLIYAKFDFKKDLKPIYKIQDFKNAGYEVKSLKGFGYSAKEIKDAGFTIKDLVFGGFNPETEVKPMYKIIDFVDSGYGAKGLKLIGYSNQEIKDTGFTIKDFLSEGGFDVTKDLKPMFTIYEFKKAGFDARRLKSINYTAKEMKESGISFEGIKNAGFSAQELKDAGYTN